MDSFAIWYEQNNKSNARDIRATLNFNLWKLNGLYKYKYFYVKSLRESSYKKELCRSKECEYAFDIGVNVKKICNIKNIYLYVPFKLETGDIKDLGSVMINNKKVIDGIFNENCKVTKSGYENAIEVEIPREQNKSQKIKIFVLDFEWEGNIKIEQKSNGTVIIIDTDLDEFKDVSEDIDSYFRFRIYGKSLRKLIDIEKIRDNFLKPYSEKNDIIDFRVNEKRSMPESLVNLINSKNEFEIEAIHFLLLMDMKYSLIATGLNYSVRALETKIWDEYIGYEIENMRFVGYHWKEKSIEKNNKTNYVENFNSLIRIEEKKCSWITIIIYVFGVIILSCAGSFIYDIIF